MKQRTRTILILSLWTFTGFCIYTLGGFGEPSVSRPNKIDAVVECQAEIKAKLAPKLAKFDNAFRYKGTKEVTEGSKFQVAGKVNGKHYGCIVNHVNSSFVVEVIL